MKYRLQSLIVILVVLIVVSSCGSDPGKKLIGTWKAEDVQTDFNEQEMTPEMLAQIVELQKQTYFRFLNDSVIIIISNNNTHEAHWKFNEEENIILYFFEGSETSPNELGKLENGFIIQESSTAMGKITVTYGKEN